MTRPALSSKVGTRHASSPRCAHLHSRCNFWGKLYILKSYDQRMALPVLSPSTTAFASSTLAHHRYISSQFSCGTNRRWFSLGSSTCSLCRRDDNPLRTTIPNKRGGHVPSSYVFMPALKAACRRGIHLHAMSQIFIVILHRWAVF